MTQIMLNEKGRTMKQRIILLTIIVALYGVIFTGVLFVQHSRTETADAGAVFAANQLIAGGNYVEAIRIYEQFIAQGINDSTVFYNLGNAYYRIGDTGRAVLNYQRAIQLSPRDDDIRANLALARSQAQDPFVDTVHGPLSTFGNITGRWLNLDETALLMLGLWFFTGLLLLLWQEMTADKWRRLLRTMTVITILLVLIGSLSLGSRLFTTRAQPEGVIVAETISVSAEPGVEYPIGVALPGGTTVNLTEVRGDWVHMIAPGNAQDGWIPFSAVETVTNRPTVL